MNGDWLIKYPETNEYVPAPKKVPVFPTAHQHSYERKRAKLPRKLKKAAKDLLEQIRNGKYDHCCELYHIKVNTKHRRKAYYWLCRPILKIPKKSCKTSDINVQRWLGYEHIMPVLIEPHRTFLLSTIAETMSLVDEKAKNLGSKNSGPEYPPNFPEELYPSRFSAN